LHCLDGGGGHNANTTPILLSNHKEISKILHLAAPPTTKAGTKEKAETAVAAAACTNGITHLGGKIKSTDARVNVIELKMTNGLRALESRATPANIGKIKSHLDFFKSRTHTGLSPECSHCPPHIPAC
jgi:hypothetical protein